MLTSQEGEGSYTDRQKDEGTGGHELKYIYIMYVYTHVCVCLFILVY